MSAFRDTGPQVALIAGGRKLHLQHGPIDLIIEAVGKPQTVRSAYDRAISAFQSVLTDLCEELSALRCPVDSQCPAPTGAVATRMVEAVRPHDAFITPMAAVAGSVADHILAQLVADRSLKRAYVNNGGDIAVHLRGNETFRIGVCANPETGQLASTVMLGAADGIGGIATSGWRGRSHSLGIADAVTVLARTAAYADAAATLIANAVDLPGSPAVTRQPASELSPDSDLGSRLVTQNVARLDQDDVAKALEAGAEAAYRMIERGLITTAFLTLQGTIRIAGRELAAIGQTQQPTRTHRATSAALHA